MNLPLKYIGCFLLASNFLFAQNLHRIQVCLAYPANPAENNLCTIKVNETIVRVAAKDTCLFVVSKSNKVAILVEADGFLPQKFYFNIDTLKNEILSVLMTEKINQLREVIIKTGSLVSYRGDTLILKVDSTLAKPHANAKELLEKMAGVLVDKDGQVRVMGKAVNRVMVDGNLLFGSNSKATLEAIKSDMVKQLEIVDKGTVELNIRLKEDKKNGVYGEIGTTIGTSNTNLLNARVNKISPKKLINFFFNSNNLNERSLSSQSESQIFRNTFFNSINNGAYSVISNAISDGAQMRPNRFNRAPSVSDNNGLSRSTSAGLNYNAKSLKSQWTGYLLLDYDNQKVFKNEDVARTFSQSQQLENTQSQNSLNRIRVWNHLTGTININAKNTIRLSNAIAFKDENQVVSSLQLSKIVEENKVINEGIFNSASNQSNQNFSASQQLQYEHRYERPAKVTSFYVGNYYQTQTNNKDFNNSLQKNSLVFANHNRIAKEQYEHFLSIQAIHSTPLSRKLLLELKADVVFDYSNTNQMGYRIIDSISTLSVSPKLSIADFRVIDNQVQLQSNFLFKSAKWSIAGGLNRWNWHTTRKDARHYFADTLNTKLIPQFYISYQFDKYTKLSFKYEGNKPILPNSDLLFPIIDSSMIQRLSIGNPKLINSIQQQYEMRFQTNILGKNPLNLSVKYQQTDNPVVPQTRFDFLGFPTQSYTQAGRVKQIDVFTFWGNFSSQTAINYHLVGIFSNQEFLNLVDTKINKIQNNMYLILGSLKFRGLKDLTAQLDFQYLLLRQNGKSSNNQGDAALRVEAKIAPKLYFESNTRINLLRNLDSQPIAYSLSNINLYGYGLKGEKMRFSLGINNIFNVKNTYLFSSTDNFRQIQSINRLPRFFTIGLTFYVEKWKK